MRRCERQRAPESGSEEARMWNVILWFVIGGVIGWLAQRFVLIGRPGMTPDIVVGAVSAVAVNVILSLLIPGYFSFVYMNIPSLFYALAAAIIATLVAHIVTAVVRAKEA
jgi:uncharacterized membrane protein YeaQ/YmgE (transglycosylase-associated protein family)